MLLLPAALLALVTACVSATFARTYATDSFPLNDVEIPCGIDDPGILPAEVPCEMSDFKLLASPSHPLSLLMHYFDPKVTSWKEYPRIYDYRSTPWRNVVFGTYVRNVSFVEVVMNRLPRALDILEFQVMRNYSDRFVLQSFVSFNVPAEQRIVFKVDYCGHNNANGTMLKIKQTKLKLNTTSEGKHETRMREFIKNSFLIFVKGMEEHCNRREVSVDNILMSNESSPILDSDGYHYPFPMDSSLRQIAYHYILATEPTIAFKKLIFTVSCGVLLLLLVIVGIGCHRRFKKQLARHTADHVEPTVMFSAAGADSILPSNSAEQNDPSTMLPIDPVQNK